MASSLIKINEATAAELQQLPMIGPRRAERIIRYREEVSQITSEEELALATGLGITRARTLAARLEWASKPTPSFARLIPPVAIFLVSLALIFYGAHEITLGTAGPVGTMYNAAILMVLMACLSTIIGLLGRELNFASRLQRPTLIISIAAFSAGFLMLLSLVLINVIIEQHGQHILQTLKFVMYSGLVIYLLYGPDIHYRISIQQASPSGTLRRAAMIFDYVQIPLAWLAMILAWVVNTPSLIEEIFSLWAGVIFFFNGLEMAKGRSSWLATLSGKDRDRVHFLVREEADTFEVDTRVQRMNGVILLLTGVALPVVALMGLLA